MRINDLMFALSQFNENQTIEIVTASDLLAKLTDGDIWPRFLTGKFGSYRGCYEDMHISYDMENHGHNTVGQLKKTLTNAIAQGIMYGYKGGEYMIDGNTKVWVATDYGDYSGLFASDVREVNGSVFIVLCEDSL
jgi:hypothetical protein